MSAGSKPLLRQPAARLLLLTGVAAAALLLSLTSGAAPLSPATVLDVIAGGGSDLERTILLQLRLPRAVLAALVGGSLALSGATFQALLRNPLAEPYVLGVSGGAALGAVAALALGLTLIANWAVPLAALFGAITAILTVFRIAAGAGRTLDPRTLLLAGVIVAAFFNAIILLLLSLADTEVFRSAIFWLMGSLAGADWAANIILAAYVLPAAIILLRLARPLNLMAIGEETALHLGTPVESVKRLAFFIASLLVAAGVAICGVIGFVGLIVPHAIRLAWGNDHRLLLPAAALAGAAFLLLADTLARTLVAPAELPVGVVTALVGVPVFVILLMRRTL